MSSNHDDEEIVDEHDWYFGDDNEPVVDVTRCCFCLTPEQHDEAGRVIACCRAMQEAWEDA